MFTPGWLPGQQMAPLQRFSPAVSLSHKLINAPRTYGCKHREVIICKSQRCILRFSFCLGHMPWSLSGQCDGEISDSAVFVSMETAKKKIKLCFSLTRTVSLGHILYLLRIGHYSNSHCSSASLYIVLWNKKSAWFISEDNECDSKRDVRDYSMISLVSLIVAWVLDKSLL